MRSKYHIFALTILILILPVANATYDYSIPVGTHEVRFNTSSPICKSPSLTDFGYESQYSPTCPLGSADNPMYTTSTTTLTLRNDYRPFLEVEVRDFEKPIPMNAMELEANTLSDFLTYIPLSNRRSTHYFSNGIVAEYENESFGALMNWHSDQIEIIITGSLPSIDIWNDISKSLELVR